MKVKALDPSAQPIVDKINYAREWALKHFNYDKRLEPLFGINEDGEVIKNPPSFDRSGHLFAHRAPHHRSK